MNLNSILDSLDGKNFEKELDRRDILKNLGSKLAMAAIPFAAAAMPQKAKAQTQNEQIAALNLILRWAYLNETFYTEILKNEDLFKNRYDEKGYLETIQKQKSLHVGFVKHIIGNAGGAADASPAFDLSGGKGSNSGPFQEALKDYRKMLALAQTIEDTTIRTVKGSVTTLMTSDDAMAGVGRVHTVSGRHSAMIRILRKHAGYATIKPWITGGNGLTENSYMQAYYNGEAVVSQVGVNIVGLNGQAISFDTASEAFDEPIDNVTSRQLLDPFIV
jgi:hypothetical protein